MVDNADDDLLWKYADMLAGWELMRYLVAEDRADRQDVGLRKLVRKVAAVQWDEDELVKFSQVDIDREKVADLFIDLNADRLTVRDRREPDVLVREPLGGAADHILKHNPTVGTANAPWSEELPARASRPCRSTSPRSTAALLFLLMTCGLRICPWSRSLCSRSASTSAATPAG
jgi:hypothetical protein